MSMSDYYMQGSEYSPIATKKFTEQPPGAPQPEPTMYESNVPPMQPTQPMQPIQPMQLAHPNMMPQYKYNMDAFSLDFKDILKRAIKYLLEGLAVAFVAYYFTKGKLNLKDVVLLGITAAFTFAILDTFSPTISLGARFGAGFGIGQAMFGLNPALMAPMMPHM
jgi:hypothetical protein